MIAQDVLTNRPASAPEIGAVLGGRYRVLAKLGEGAMGSVFRAEHLITDKQVAIKWLHAHSEVAKARLLREARATALIRHPNVVDIYDVVLTADDELFLVMELLEGETLRAYLDRGEALEIGPFIRLLLPALRAVASAHASGVIHRDLKPDNIFLSRDDSGVTPRVLDFGISTFVEPRLDLLAEGGAVGTPVYMSPEQLRADRDIDVRADVYAVGVMLYEAIAGRLPHSAQSLPDLLFKVLSQDPLPLELLRPDIPQQLAKLIDWALARQREQRLPSMSALILELEIVLESYDGRGQYLGNQTGVLTSAQPASQVDLGAQKGVAPLIIRERGRRPSREGKAERSRRPKRAWLQLLGGVTATLLAIGAAGVWISAPVVSKRESRPARPIDVAPTLEPRAEGTTATPPSPQLGLEARSPDDERVGTALDPRGDDDYSAVPPVAADFAGHAGAAAAEPPKRTTRASSPNRTSVIVRDAFLNESDATVRLGTSTDKTKREDSSPGADLPLPKARQESPKPRPKLDRDLGF